ncbi:MAG: FHA domain-containing protein [Alphaproteobacteria bacterium]|nr:FHA domain-containing protein [Alphaproteobacteria bacterium]
MIVRTSIVLVVTGTLFTLVGLFAPAANLGAAATPASLYQIVGGLLEWKVGAPELPAGLRAIQMQLLGGSGVLLVSAFLAISLAVFKFLRTSLVPCVFMTLAAGYLMFTMAGMRDVAVAVPQSYGWILLIAGSLVASVTALFTLFGPGPEEAARRKTMSELPKKRGRLPFEVETPTYTEPRPAPEPPPKPAPPKPAPPKPVPPKAKPPKPVPPTPAPVQPSAPAEPGKQKIPPPQRDTPKPQRLSKALKPDAPKPNAPSAPKEDKPATPKPADGDAPKAGVPDLTPDTLAPMPTNGYSGEEPTESGGWVLSGFDANGMAVRLNISDVDLRTAEDGILIGRNAKQCRLVLNDDSVSRRHARLSGGSPLTIEDLDSANGTVVNREALAPGQKVPIEPGVAIEIGGVRLTLVRS